MTKGMRVLAAFVCAASVSWAHQAAAADEEVGGGGWDLFSKDNPITQGKILFDARLRYEFVSQNGLSDANAATGRIRLGYQTAWWHGFAALIEAEATGGINQDHNYRIPGLSDQPTSTAVVADPTNAEINRANLQYKNDDIGVQGNLYRQRIILGNSRWVGNVGWRQNEQTYDAIRVGFAPKEYVPDFNLTYAYIWQTNRIFGLWSGRDVKGGAAGKWYSDSHLVNASYTGCSLAKVTVYYYGFDNERPTPLASNSNNFGAYLQGSYELNEKSALSYYAEYDHQSSAFGNPTDYDASYFHLIAGGTYDIVSFAAALEWLGADDGLAAQFPYGTNHKWNGWADLFLNTPTFGNTGDRAAGLRDLYFTAGVKIPVIEVPMKVIYHKFWSDEGEVSDLGNEIDIVFPRKLGPYLTLLLKGAYYWGAGTGSGDAPVRPDTGKLWLEADYKF